MNNTTNNATAPLLKVGNFGTHIMENPTHGFSFVGTCPKDLRGIYPTAEAAEDAFVAWFKALDRAMQRQYIGDLRNDIFFKVMA